MKTQWKIIFSSYYVDEAVSRADIYSIKDPKAEVMVERDIFSGKFNVLLFIGER